MLAEFIGLYAVGPVRAAPSPGLDSLRRATALGPGSLAARARASALSYGPEAETGIACGTLSQPPSTLAGYRLEFIRA